MEYGSRLRFVLLSVGAILLLVLSAWGVISISKKVFKRDTPTTSQSQKIDLEDYSRPSTSVKVTVEGPIVADENYVSYEIEIGQDFRRITTYKGYGRAVVESKRYDNNREAYDVFLKALKKAGYTNVSETASADETGACATGRKYIYELKDLDEEVVRSWNSTCSKVAGNFRGTGTAVRALFKSQIPDYAEVTKSVKLAN